MINISKIICIICSGLALLYFIIGILNSVLGLNIIKRVHYLFGIDDKKKKKSSEIDINDRVEILMDKYGIKSTEKTGINLKYLVNSPSHFIFNKSSDIKLEYLKNSELKKLSLDKISNGIIEDYIYNKKIFEELFVNNDNSPKIRNLKDFHKFQEQNIITKNLIKYNVLLKFFTNDKYMYIFVTGSEFIKIKNYEEYDKICELLEKNIDIFLIRQITKDGEKYNITHGGLSSSNFDIKQLTDTFFKNKQNINKNFKLLSNFDNVNIYFYVSTQINK